ncbi:MAG: hypothetical protein V2J20_02930 [Wenzhouxiangella sp.]|nr:hypothetical protein [Wenzhouxiangella sp.]
MAEGVATLIEALHDLEQRLKVTRFDHESAGLDLQRVTVGWRESATLLVRAG